MRTLLTVVGDGTATPVLETALLAARKFDGRVIGLNALTNEYAVVFGGEMGFSVSSEVDRTLEREGHDRRVAARELFENFMRGRAVPLASDDGPARFSFAWSGARAEYDTFVGSHGRLFDLIVLGRPGRTPQDPRMEPLEAALFESGQPVLIAPRSAPASIGENVLVAWNGSTEQARTTRFALPLLRQAREVTVLSVEGIVVRMRIN